MSHLQIYLEKSPFFWLGRIGLRCPKSFTRAKKAAFAGVAILRDSQESYDCWACTHIHVRVQHFQSSSLSIIYGSSQRSNRHTHIITTVILAHTCRVKYQPVCMIKRPRYNCCAAHIIEQQHLYWNTTNFCRKQKKGHKRIIPCTQLGLCIGTVNIWHSPHA